VQRPTAPPAAARIAAPSQPVTEASTQRAARHARPAVRHRTPPHKTAKASTLTEPLTTLLAAAPAPTWRHSVREAGASRTSQQPRDHRSPLPGPPTGLSAGSGSASTGGALFLGLLLGFILAFPNVCRWLRRAVALGLTPVMLDARARPG
jgi:hypothetical protein